MKSEIKVINNQQVRIYHYGNYSCKVIVEAKRGYEYQGSYEYELTDINKFFGSIEKFLETIINNPATKRIVRVVIN